MNLWLTLALLVTLSLLAVTGVQLWRLRAQLQALVAQAAALSTAPAPRDGLKSGLITIEILNPLELAARRSKVFGLVGSLTPDLVRRLVQQETLKILAEELRARGVQAEVKLHDPR
jgi:hypothetical protein